MERYPKKIEDQKINEAFDFVFQNAFGSPIIFDSAPTKAQMRANSWGKVTGENTAIYIKFSDGGAMKITGDSLA